MWWARGCHVGRVRGVVGKEISYLRRWSPAGWAPIACRSNDGNRWACGRSSCRSCARERPGRRSSMGPTPWSRAALTRSRSRQIFTARAHWAHTYYWSTWSRNRTRASCCRSGCLHPRITCPRRISAGRPVHSWPSLELISAHLFGTLRSDSTRAADARDAATTTAPFGSPRRRPAHLATAPPATPSHNYTSSAHFQLHSKKLHLPQYH